MKTKGKAFRAILRAGENKLKSHVNAVHLLFVTEGIGGERLAACLSGSTGFTSTAALGSYEP